MRYNNEYVEEKFGRIVRNKDMYEARGKIVKKEVFGFDFNEDSKVLEFGCGIGQNLICIKYKFGYDINKKIYPLLREKGFVLFDSEDKIPDNFFDEILIHNVLEHLPNPVNTLKMLRKKIKRGGKIRVCVPDLSYESYLRNGKEVGMNDTKDGHLFAWTFYELNYLMNYCGYHNLLNKYLYREGYERLIPFYRISFYLYYFLVWLVGRWQNKFDIMVVAERK